MRETRRVFEVFVYCLAVFALSRLLLELIGVGARELVFPILQPEYRRAVFSDSAWLDIWGVWDTEWFLGIVENGYDKVANTAPGLEGQANWAFYPLYPLLSEFVSTSTGLSPYSAMLAVSNAAFLAALPIIWFETRYHYGEAAAGIAVVLFAFLPGSYVFSSAYSESLFLLAVMASLAFARRERWLLAGLAAALATLTRNLGILLVIPIIIHSWQAHGGWRDRDVLHARRLAIVIAVLLPAAALAAFMTYLWRHTGDPLAFATVQGAWKRELQNPFVTLIGPFLVGGKVQAEIVPSIFMSWISVWLTILLFMRRNWAHAGFTAAVVAITLASGILSYFRLFLTMAPAIMVAGSYFAIRPAAWPVALGLLAAANGFMMACWALGIGIY